MKPVARYLSFTGNAGCYGLLPLGVLAGATTFTIEVKFSTASTKNGGSNYTWATIIGREIGGFAQNDFGLCVNNGKLCFWAEPKSGGSSSTHNTTSSAIVNDGKIHKAAVVANADGSIDLYCDGKLVAHTDNVNAKITDTYKMMIAYNSDSSSYLQMDLWEARFWSIARTQEQIFADIQGDEAGLEAWYIPNGSATLVDGSINGRDATLYGSPAYTYIDILPIDLSFDVVRRVFTPWRYVNAGTADDLIVTGTTLTDLPESKSKTGCAFYQTERVKCFDIPATDEIWIKFDVYFDGSKRWRAYNGGSNGTTGITAQTDGRLGFFSNDTDKGHFNDVCKKNQLQTVLLHMVSGSSNGIIEAWVDGNFIYRYTGDVNHGEDFADIYLQSDGSGTFFSNVIISNAEIELGEGWQIFTFDVERQVAKAFDIDFDVERQVKNVMPFQIDFDVELQDILPVTIAADVERRVIVPVNFTADVELLAVMRVDFTADVSRNIKTNFIAYATDNSQYLSGGNTPVVIPSQTVIPPVNDSDANMQSIEISIAEQQITDQVKLVGIVPFDIMFPVQGQYLDYYCDMRVERVQRQGILYSADCCSDIDELFYTQINYSVPDDQHIIFKADLNSGIMQQYSGEVSEEDTVIYKAYAGNHLNRIAEALGKSCVCQFDDFVSNMEVNQENVTYSDLISQLFGWSSRVPNRMINCFLHGDTLFAIQRGQEANVIDISGSDKTLPTYTREIVRTTWGSSAKTNDTTKYQTGTAKKTIYHAGHKIYFPPPNGSPDGKTSYSYTSVSPRGWCLASTETRNDDGSRVIVDYHYGTGHYGEMVLTSETRISYDAEGNKVDESKTVHHNLSPSQQYSRVDDEDGSDMGSSVGSNLPGFYCEWGWVSLPEEIVQEKAFVILASEYDTWVKYYEDKGIEVDWSSVYQIPSSIDTSDFLKEYSFANSAFADTEKQMKSYSDFFSKVTSGTTSGTSLVDTAFPVTDSETLLLLILALKWLNRRTKETVTLSIYNFPHVIDFNDRVVLFGETYFLVSNRALSNNRRFNEQNLTLVRWF